MRISLGKTLSFVSLVLGILFVAFVLWPTETNGPSTTVEVKFLQNRATRISLGSDTEMRLAVLADRPQRAISVACPRSFNADPSRSYFVDGFDLRDENGRTTPTTWVLRQRKECYPPLNRPFTGKISIGATETKYYK